MTNSDRETAKGNEEINNRSVYIMKTIENRANMGDY